MNINNVANGIGPDPNNWETNIVQVLNELEMSIVSGGVRGPRGNPARARCHCIDGTVIPQGNGNCYQLCERHGGFYYAD